MNPNALDGHDDDQMRGKRRSLKSSRFLEISQNGI
jgi:hypothetical protein